MTISYYLCAGGAVRLSPGAERVRATGREDCPGGGRNGNGLCVGAGATSGDREKDFGQERERGAGASGAGGHHLGTVD